jgi:hypothetical protein
MKFGKIIIKIENVKQLNDIEKILNLNKSAGHYPFPIMRDSNKYPCCVMTRPESNDSVGFWHDRSIAIDGYVNYDADEFIERYGNKIPKDETECFRAGNSGQCSTDDCSNYVNNSCEDCERGIAETEEVSDCECRRKKFGWIWCERWCPSYVPVDKVIALKNTIEDWNRDPEHRYMTEGDKQGTIFKVEKKK